MATGAAEVENGATLAIKSGAALDDITTAVAATRDAVVRITSAVGAMSEASAGVVASIDAIAGIAQTTNAAATDMTRNAGDVSRTVGAIAAVSEENSAAAEEVSAATEQMTAQVSETIASARGLAEMAERLDALVARFALAGPAGDTSLPGDDQPVDPVVIRRRRATDWNGRAA
jgi:methyl-accepting chemotaxis protein